MGCLRTRDCPGAGVRLHAVGWLFFANLVGLLCSLQLLHPSLSDGAGFFGYGRLVAVHANVQLYGWCALPLAGLLFSWFSSGRDSEPRETRLALAGWSLALAAGVLSWMFGYMTGKPFMEWSRLPALVMALGMGCLWLILAGWTEVAPVGTRAPRVLALLLLACVPFVFVAAASPSVYPAVNPHSGGATGTSLYLSTLGIVLVYGLTPAMLKLPRGHRETRRSDVLFWGLYVCFMITGLFLGTGHISNRQPSQVAALVSLFLWVPLLAWHLRSYVWPQGARPWLLWALLWGGLLALSGAWTFLPESLDRYKFTHMLVGHAHLAMAGLVGALGWAILHAMDPGFRVSSRSVHGWNSLLLLHLLVLGLLAVRETSQLGALYSGDLQATLLLAARSVLGAGMTLLSLLWFLQCLQHQRRRNTL